MGLDLKLTNEVDFNSDIIYYQGNVFDLLPKIPEHSIQLIFSSPPYNVGKEYEKILPIKDYLNFQDSIISNLVPLLSDNGSICWQVGSTKLDDGEYVPLDILLYPLFKKHGFKLRNRIVWTFGHGYHANKRFSGRHETLLWFTKTDDYYFNLDPIRVPQKYPGKRYWKGEKKGQYSGNPLGKNPGDVWDIPNVKAKHVEKTIHPCQFPIGVVQMCIRSMTKPEDWVLDPFAGVATTLCAAIVEGRRAIGAELFYKYYPYAMKRLNEAASGQFKFRPYNQPIFVPKTDSPLLYRNDEVNNANLSNF